MEPQCHPTLEKDVDLEKQQAAFFATAQQSSTHLLKSSNPKRPVVLAEVIERTDAAPKPVQPPTARPPPQPSRKTFTKPATTAASLTERQEISQQNEQLLQSLTPEEVVALQEEMRASIPESFLRKLQNK